jgi:hypothetical protein
MQVVTSQYNGSGQGQNSAKPIGVPTTISDRCPKTPPVTTNLLANMNNNAKSRVGRNGFVYLVDTKWPGLPLAGRFGPAALSILQSIILFASHLIGRAVQFE